MIPMFGRPECPRNTPQAGIDQNARPDIHKGIQSPRVPPAKSALSGGTHDDQCPRPPRGDSNADPQGDMSNLPESPRVTPGEAWKESPRRPFMEGAGGLPRGVRGGRVRAAVDVASLGSSAATGATRAAVRWAAVLPVPTPARRSVEQAETLSARRSEDVAIPHLTRSDASRNAPRKRRHERTSHA